VTALALVLAPVTCSVVLLVSGVAKVGDAEATRAAFIAMNVPTFLRARSVVRSLPYGELALGIALLATWGWLLAAVGAIVTALFLTYFLLVARALRSGDQVHCNCFGTIGDDRVTRATLARNGVLAVLAILAIVFGAAGSGVVPALRDFEAADWWWSVMVVLVAAAAVLVTAPGRPERQAEVPDEDLVDYLRQRIPFGMLQNEERGNTTLRQLVAHRAQLLVFMSVGCGSCHEVAAHLVDWSARLGPVELSTVFTSPLDDIPDDLKPPGIKRWFDGEGAVTDMFSAGRPSAVLLGADGMLAGGPVAGTRAIIDFVDDILAELEAARLPEQVEDTGHDHTGHGHQAETSA
jgi:hypothetical protein